MITPLYYFKWMFQTYAYVMALMAFYCCYCNSILFATIFMYVCFLFGFISDDVIGMDIWRLERNESSKTKNL